MPLISAAVAALSRKKVTTMLVESSRAMCWRLFDNERKTPTIRKDRQMIVTEKMFLARYCHKLLAVTPRKYFSFS
jgi:hypothetical protein